MSDTTTTTSSASGLGMTLIFIVLLILKVGIGDTGVQDWSWWIITAPLWGPFALIAAILTIMLVVTGVIGLAVVAMERWL